ncbi:MAG TPA: hypothetical protein VHG53_05735 [Candidatus Limnocylindria bacterium]|nr:hypothetical protein [Candidatus Limnocylindria bacterium]
MVDALHAAHRALRADGTLIDLRPDSDHPPYVRHAGAEPGGFRERDVARGDSAASDRAIDRVMRDGDFELIRAGHFWYSLRFTDLAQLDAWVETSRRIAGYERGTRARLAAHPDRPITVRRALKYAILARV